MSTNQLERNKQICIDVLNGNSYAIVGLKNDISGERVRSIFFKIMRIIKRKNGIVYHAYRHVNDYRNDNDLLIKLVKHL